jgi:hypothetical protein
MYQKLAAELMERNIDQNCLARKLDVCVMSICDRFSGKTAWSPCEQQAILDLLREPREMQRVYFP